MLAAAGAALTYGRVVHRYRDPVRLARPGPGELLAPADGRVAFVRRVTGGRLDVPGLNGPLDAADLLGAPAGLADGWLLGVHVGALDVRFVTVPLAGPLAALTGPAGNLLAGRGTLENERLTLRLTGPDGTPVTLALVAPGRALNARRYVAPGDAVQAGVKLAFLPEGALVLLHVPEAFVPQVSVGGRVQAGLTPLARRGEQGPEGAPATV
jgi:phosphatidylserine decarboxylase